MVTGSGRRDRAGPSATKWPRCEVAEHLGLPALHAEQVGGAGHVDVEEGAAHQEVGGFGRDVLGELGQALRGDDAGQAALAAAAHQVGHGAERELSRLVGDLAGDGRGKELRLVDHDQHRVPVVALGIEQPAEKGGGARICCSTSRPSRLSTTETRCWRTRAAMRVQLGLAALGIDHDMAELVGQGDEIALGIDDASAAPSGALCSSRRRSRCDLPEPELPCTSRRVASSSSRSSRRFRPALRHTHVDANLHGL